MLYLDASSSNLDAFKYLFSNGEGRIFRDAIARSFSFAADVIKIIKDSSVNHHLELWDQAVSYKLSNIINAEAIFTKGVRIYLEKQESDIVWHFGFSILKTENSPHNRKWILPDGLIKTSDEIFAIEFDHGKTIGKWANQLLKALRIFDSDKIDGVIYCYCFERGSSIKHFSDKVFTDEFIKLVNVYSLKKKIGVIILFPDELPEDMLSKIEVINFLNAVYQNSQRMAIRSKKKVEQIVAELQKM